MIDNTTQLSPKNADPAQLDTSMLPLVSVIRFFDGFSDRTRTIRTDQDEWYLITDGKTCSINWKQYEPNEALFLKKFMAWAYGHLDSSSAFAFIGSLNRDATVIAQWLRVFSNPKTAKSTWEINGFNRLKTGSVYVIRSITKFMCEMSLCGWTVDDTEYLRGWNWFTPPNVSNVEHGIFCKHSIWLNTIQEPVFLH